MWWRLGRWDTVDAMLTALDPKDIVWAKAAYETIPLDDGWRQADTIAGSVHDEMERYMAGKAGKSRVDRSRLHKAGEYIPRLVLKQRSGVTVNNASIDYVHALIRSHHGHG